MNLHFVTIAIILSAIAGCIGDTAPNARSPHEAGTSAAERADDRVVTSLPAITAIEGLPHPFDSAFTTEKAKDNIHSISEHLFYDGRISLSADDHSQVRNTLEEKDSYAPHTEEKLCGGFHPDWAVEIGTGAGKTVYLICFGCHEVIVLEGVGGDFHYDLADEAYDLLRRTLATYHVKLPHKSRPQITAEQNG